MLFACLSLLCVVGAAAHSRAAAQTRQSSARVGINEIMADPAAVADERGEWFEIHNPGSRRIDLRGYRIASGNDPVHVIARSLVIAPGGYIVLARDANQRLNGGVAVRYAYGASISLANGGD